MAADWQGFVAGEDGQPPDGDDAVVHLDLLGLLTPGEVATLLHVDANTVARWSNEGRLRAIRTPGGHRRYPASEVLRLIRNDGSPAPAPRRAPQDPRQGETG